MPVISGLKTNAITIGTSNTDTNNFQLRSNADGTATLARKSDGSGGDVLTIDGSGNVALPANTSNKLVSASGSAPVYACRAWVNFNGTGTVAIRASGNVSSITDTGVGNYTVNFTTAMPDLDFSTSVTAGSRAGGATNIGSCAAQATTSVAVQSYAYNINSFNDVDQMAIAVFR